MGWLLKVLLFVHMLCKQLTTDTMGLVWPCESLTLFCKMFHSQITHILLVQKVKYHMMSHNYEYTKVAITEEERVIVTRAWEEQKK